MKANQRKTKKDELRGVLKDSNHVVRLKGKMRTQKAHFIQLAVSMEELLTLLTSDSLTMLSAKHRGRRRRRVPSRKAANGLAKPGDALLEMRLEGGCLEDAVSIDTADSNEAHPGVDAKLQITGAPSLAECTEQETLTQTQGTLDPDDNADGPSSIRQL